jgi:hypothetical protein
MQASRLSSVTLAVQGDADGDGDGDGAVVTEGCGAGVPGGG